MGLRDFIVQKWQHKDSRVRLQAIEQLEGKNAEAVLKILATTDSSRTVRKAAAKRLSAASLAEVMHQTQNESVRLEMVMEVLDGASCQSLLFDVALSDSSGYVRNAAAQKLIDGDFLFRAAMSDKHVDVAITAARNTVGRQRARTVASSAPFAAARSEALKRLDRDHDLENLLTAAQCDEDSTVRETAVRLLHLEDCPSLFVEIALSDAPSRLRAAAVQKLHAEHHKEVLSRLAATDPNAGIRKTATTALDPFEALPMLVRIVETDADAVVRRTAVERMDVESMLGRLSAVALSDPDKFVQKGAAEKIALLKKRDKKTLLFELGNAGLSEWNKFLIHVALKAKDPLVREAALSAVDSLGFGVAIEKIATLDKDPAVRRQAIKKLDPASTKGVLESILEKDKDKTVRRLAESRLSSVKPRGLK
jgi:hypothetical protein